ncbi:unnamed protein product [Rhizophagus irregularis]|uniref:Protein kinase domain-containing protein n=5 Tax=Rhizophagus irregularis TaxID=588596 RepID=A0A915ZRW2_9GLOM|nr:unnamed protein product [Rhizophagus irregularis]
MSLYDDQPIVYISVNESVNDHDSCINSLSFNSDESINYDKTLQPSDICINFPVAEITYTANLTESFLNSSYDVTPLSIKYGHLFARKILVGGKIFIDDLELATSTQEDLFKSYLTWAYSLAKYNKENPFTNLLTPDDFFPRIRTLDGENLNSYDKLTNWMMNLYKKNIVDIISYNDFILVSELRSNKSSSIDEKQPGVFNFKERLSFEDWAVYANLIRWINESHLFQGLMIDKQFELMRSKKMAINFTKIPKVESSNKFYMKMMSPTTKVEEFLTSNNIFSIKDVESFPFIKELINSENISYKDYVHFLVKLEQYRITSDISPSEEFKQAIEKALESMKPLMCLQDVFDEYGHFFPLNVVLGKSLKNILPNSLPYKIDLRTVSVDSLKSHLDKLNISYLLTEKGDVIDKNNLSNWIQNTNDDLEVIEFENIVSLHRILEIEQQKKIDVILNRKGNLKIIMTGIDELKDLNINNTEHYKRINIEPSLEDEDYEVFGSVISKYNLKSEDFLVTFELYDINGFSIMIKTLKNTNINITECYILWMVIGNPSKLSVFSPRNREFQVDCIKESVELQPNNFYYPVKTSYELSEGCTISVNAYCSTANYEPINIKIKLAGWSEDCIYLQIIETNLDSSDISDDYDQLTSIEITVCVLYSNYENLEIDNKEVECSLNLIGCILTESTKVIPFSKFFPLISEISNMFNEIIEITQTAEHNKRICDILKQRIDAADLAVRNLKIKKNNQGFFNHNNYIYLQNLVNVITHIKNFMSEISQMKTLLKYIQAKSIEKTFDDLRKDFDNCINSLAFTITIKNSYELEQLKADQEDLTKYLENTSNDNITEVETIMKLKNKNSLNIPKTNNNSYAHQLEIIDYEKTEEKPRKNGRVTKWVSAKNKSEGFAFKIIHEEEKNTVQNQITILKGLHDWQNIIRIYGLTCEGNIKFLVSEWAKYGNLREYYTNYKDRFNLRLKLRISLDIARGLNYLSSVEIVHRDIRTENILITLYETAKLANFKLSRSLSASTLKQSQNLERVRYCAPELLKRAHNFKYDHKCEVYSFGILLWEIAEERTPYKQYKDIVKITDMVCNYKYRESFSKDSQMPSSFINLALKAVDHDPKFRPEISKMLEVLNNCFEESKTQVSYIPDIPQNLEATSKHILQNEYAILDDNLQNLTVASSSSSSTIVEEIVPFAKFHPLINEIRSILNEIIEITQVAEHNKRICDVLKLRVYAVDLAIFELNVMRNNQEFYNRRNYSSLQSLISVIMQIKKFITDISQMKNLIKLKYVHPEKIEKTFKELCREFDICIINIDLVSFRDMVNNRINRIRPDESLKSDQDFSNYFAKIIEEIGIDIKELSNEFISMVLKVDAMNNTMEKLLDEKNYSKNDNDKNVNDKSNEMIQSKIDKIFVIRQLRISDYEKTDEKPRKDGRVTKWVNIKNEGEEVAFKITSEKERANIQNQVTILKALHDWQNFARIYGLTCEKNKWYLVSEWAEYGNLREYYTNHKDRFDIRLKLRISRDIACGLNFLRTFDIVHRDVRAKNILITLHETAKLANFKFSRSLFAATLKQSQNLERVRYCAPELLERAHNFKYDHKCEVYSFGILLWEIAEERTPYEQYKDIVKITDMVCSHKYRESFSKDSRMPLSFIDLALKAVDHDLKLRPEISKMLEVLNNCFEESKTQVSEEIVSFSKFLPLINEIRSIHDEITEIAQAAEHNKRICDVLKLRVYAVNLATFELNVMRNNQKLFNRRNYSSLQSLVTVITQIKKFITDISQMKKLKYVQPKNIEKTFKDLCKEFDICIINIDLASFRDMVNNRIRSEEETKSLKLDQEDLSDYLAKNIEEVGIDIKGLSNKFTSMVVKVNAMNNAMEKLLDEQTKQQSKNDNDKTVNDKLKQMIQSKIDKIFVIRQLRISDYEKTDKEPRKDGRVTKWVNIKNKGEEFAFKIVTEEERANVQNQVTILKELHDWQNITRIYGLTCEGNKWFLVSEWAEYGNLREYYTNYKDRFDIRLKLRMSRDIARGLNFLRAIEIVHRDIRAENILITLYETAKLANFKFSRSLFAATLKQSQNLERVRYCAPELLERAHNFKYDHKCEVYSFGILLWEIAEERTPYEQYNDIVRITDLVRDKKYRESFSKDSRMPQSYMELANKAVNHDPEFRPKITDTFEVLSRCFEEYEKPHSKSSSNPKSSQYQNITLSSSEPIPNPESIINRDEYAIKTSSDYELFKYMTLAEAAKQHKMVDRQGKPGDTKTAYKCFESYADADTTVRNKIVAKYYKAYYISRGLVDNIEVKDKDRIVAELYKEVADDEANEFPEAKLRYGDCLYNGKGVEKNLPEALKYFEEAADNGYKVAMYNAGKLYYNGYGVERNKEKAIRYMKLAIYNEYEPAMKFCRDNNINLN